MSEVSNISASEGVFKVLDDFVNKYSKEVILRRAIPDVRDGFKPVLRRALWQAHEGKMTKGFHKSSVLLGRVGPYHPHGEDSIYQAVARYTHSNGCTNFPLFLGQGGWGNAMQAERPASSRYTEIRMHDNAEEFFHEWKGVEWRLGETGNLKEPECLPVNFPHILVANNMGIAVSVASNIPSYNFHDVLNLTESYVTKGRIDREDLIIPDFPTGGILVHNEKEFFKILMTGRGRIQTRAKVEIKDKIIYVKEPSVEMSTKSIQNKIRTAKENGNEIKGIKDVIDSSGFDRGTELQIICSSARVVEQVLLELYSRNILQSYYNANITTVNGDIVTYSGGVQEILRQWVEWRISVIDRHYSAEREDVLAQLEELDYFIRLVMNEDWRDTYLNILIKGSGSAAASDYLAEIMPGIPDSVCSWINSRRAVNFRKVSEYTSKYESLKETLKEIEAILEDKKGKILTDLRALRVKYSGQFPRRSEVSDTAYKFTRVKEEVVEDTSMATFTVFEDGFIVKTRGTEKPHARASREMLSYVGEANDVLVLINEEGNLIRVYGEDLPYSGPSDTGSSYSQYSGSGNSGLVAVFPLEDTQKMIIYPDGWVGFLDLSEFTETKRRTRLLRNGVSPKVGEMPVKVIDRADWGEFILAAGYDENSRLYLGYAKIEDILVKSRTARTKVFDIPRSAGDLVGTVNFNTEADVEAFLEGGTLSPTGVGINLDYYNGHLRMHPVEAEGFQTYGEYIEVF